MSCIAVVYRSSDPYNVGTEHAEIPPTRHKLLAPSAKPRGVLGEWHGGGAASYYSIGYDYVSAPCVLYHIHTM